LNTLDYRTAFAEYLPHMRDPAATQANWNTVLKAFDGIELNAAELGWFVDHTGRHRVLPDGYAELVCMVGRQAGKDDICADSGNARAVRTIVNKEDVDGLFISFVAQDHRSSVRTLFHRVARPWRTIPMLRKHVVSSTADSIVLDNGLTLAAYPCRPAALRGLRNLFVACNETSHYRNSQGNAVDVEMRRAVLPTLSTTGGKLVIVSSPYLATDLIGELHRRHWGHDESSTLIVQASAPELNPTLPLDYLQRMEQDDPEAYRSEVLGEFWSGLSVFIDSQALEGCVVTRRDLPPVAGVRYFIGGDFSGGRNDAAAAYAAHREGERVIVDAGRCWPAPHNPETVAAEMAAFARLYHCGVIVADKYAGAFPAAALARHGIQYRAADLDRSALYLELLPRLLSQSVEIPNDAGLLRELRGLERKRGFGGKDRVDHRSGSHDDRSNAMALAVHLAAPKARRTPTEPSRVVHGGPGGTPTTWLSEETLREERRRARLLAQPPVFRDGTSCPRHRRPHVLEAASFEALMAAKAGWRCPVPECGLPSASNTDEAARITR
jgi:hypothetical protein